MFQSLISEVSARFEVADAYFSETKPFKGQVGATAKGHMFVEAYSIYEFTVRSSVRLAIDAVNSRRYRVSDLTPTLLSLYLDPELRSVRDVGSKGVWGARQKLFAKASAKTPAEIALDTNIPDDGSHFRYSHLQTIAAVFNIRRRLVRDLQHISRINEVVDHRNQIAHGRDTAANIGRRYTHADVRKMLRQMRSVCNCVASQFDHYCSTPTLHIKR
ncbi:MAE_28990/MAE_18760 family HEPN-like nuclease [Shinella zoogloeoides]|uniref:MAE_28990/MAE_18760 family HEPN-like nuclease n=1 Tax=Shinella zoogloeoides TaxID=352475 RepID=UPI0035305994